MQKRAGMAVAGLVIVAFVAYLAFGVFGIQAAFTNKQVAETGPSFASGATAESMGSDSLGSTSPGAGSLASVEFDAAMEEAAAHQRQVDEAMMPGKIVTLARGTFTGRNAHSVAGDALVLNDGTAQRFLRLDSFTATNGPDLKVYLRAADGRYVSLGELKGNIGSQNYEIPATVDLATYPTVQIWCERFSVLFGDATLT